MFATMRTLLGGMIAAAALSVPAGQQAPPATEVFLLELGPAARKGWINISNSPGYDNQPSFLPDSSAVLFASNRDGKQTDIYRYDIASKQLTQLTKTPEQEYSPLVTPDGKSFSVIRVEADGTTQRLWRFDLDGANPRLVLENVKPVGYHAWIDATHLALFVLGSDASPGNKLHIADTTTGQSEVIETGIGRSITIRPGTGAVAYVTSSQPRTIKEFDFKTRTTKTIVAPLEGSQDLVWFPPSGGGQLLQMASGSAISTINVAQPERGWTQAFDLAAMAESSGSPRVKQITRMAVSPNVRWLAFVAEPGTEPTRSLPAVSK